MRLDRPSFVNKAGKSAARPLSRIVCSRLFRTPARLVDAYLNFLMGKGSGTGWDRISEIRAATARIRRPQPVVFDVGANVGHWTADLLAERPDARVFLFDPSPGCQAAIRARNLPGITIIPCAVGDHPGQADFYFSSDTDGSGSLHQRGDSPFRHRDYKSGRVEIRTLDEILNSFELDFVDF